MKIRFAFLNQENPLFLKSRFISHLNFFLAALPKFILHNRSACNFLWQNMTWYKAAYAKTRIANGSYLIATQEKCWRSHDATPDIDPKRRIYFRMHLSKSSITSKSLRGKARSRDGFGVSRSIPPWKITTKVPSKKKISDCPTTTTAP